MYMNNCLFPAIVPVELAVNYWTSYSAYHEAAFAALMNSKKAHFHLREVSAFHRGHGDADSPTGEQTNKRAHSVRDKSPQTLPQCPHTCNSPAESIDSSESQSYRKRNKSSSDSRGNNLVRARHSTPSSKELKFGISRILSDEVGSKDIDSVKTEKFDRTSVREQHHFIPTFCPCSSSSCPYVICRNIPSLSSSLSAVHALRPPRYPETSGTDSMPGPYSVLNTESGGPSQHKRKRSWSRAVFSQLQRKGLEKRFEVQKYVTKPDRRQLAAILSLTDAQVKVWFQNRRMKWRHTEKSANQSPTPKDKKGDEKPSGKSEDEGDEKPTGNSEETKELSDSEEELESGDIMDSSTSHEDSMVETFSDSLDHDRLQQQDWETIAPRDTHSPVSELNTIKSPLMVT